VNEADAAVVAETGGSSGTNSKVEGVIAVAVQQATHGAQCALPE
jgi:hypothetical protein